MSGVVLVAGASGVVGQAAVEHFAAQPGWTTIALSRRAPLATPGLNFRHLSVDLTDGEACAAALADLPAITHLAYAALHEQDDLVAGWRAQAQMATNLAMLRNLLTPLAARGGLKHVSLLQGTKAYGVHLRPIKVPARERWPRHNHENFYWLQEDFLRVQAAQAGFDFTIFRPQIIFGDAIGAAMNILPALGAYGALRKAEGRPFSYPGGPDYLLEAVDARLVARALGWAALAPAARGETFNVTNGDVFVWRNVWPTIAQALGVETGPDEPVSMVDYLKTRVDAWRAIAERYALVEPDLLKLVGKSHEYTDFCMATGAQRTPPPALVSTIKIRQAGFGDCIDTEDMFRALTARLIDKRVLPPA